MKPYSLCKPKFAREERYAIFSVAEAGESVNYFSLLEKPMTQRDLLTPET
jgi:hypothetical protein